MKYLPAIAGGLLGAMFVLFSLLFLLHLAPMPPPPAGSSMAQFMDAFVPTGYLTFVKSLELIGGLLVAVPRTRNFGLLVLGPIIVNILAFHVFIMKGGLFDPILIVIVVVSTYLLWCGRRAFAGLGG
jgi:putative oxidoreductase